MDADKKLPLLPMEYYVNSARETWGPYYKDDAMAEQWTAFFNYNPIMW